MYYMDKRNETDGVPADEADKYPIQGWRMKDRLKTVSAALVICLNLGVDPPDVVKTNPTAKLECWEDPYAMPTSNTTGSTKILETIGKKLQEQYETLSMRTRYKQYLDPSVDETKKFCVSLRRNAKDERILFHYNGHGVPLPTPSGELWVFNKNYTQYIPVSLYDLQLWLAGPSIYVFDCSHAGSIIDNFHGFVEKHEAENAEILEQDPNAVVQNYGDCLLLAACGKNELLPTNPDLPADVFTSCLTTPIEMAVRFYKLENPLASGMAWPDFKISGKLQDRKSALGELNWIFTAITDTIAWQSLPQDLFKKLFRQDLMVAALFRNYLLAERILKANNCHPISFPSLPSTSEHPLWTSWDCAVERVLHQMPIMLDHQQRHIPYEYRSSEFFSEQLSAFDVYLQQAPEDHTPPDQLPIVLQVLLSQQHRLRALVLLGKFLDLGPWAVQLALSIGIFPYVVKLLQSSAVELKPVMVFIWARILAVDHTVQTELLKDNGIHYFSSIMDPSSDIQVVNASEHRAMCAFIIAIFCKGFQQGQKVSATRTLFDIVLRNLEDDTNPLLRQWSCLLLSMLWIDYPDAKWEGTRSSAYQKLGGRALDPIPEVRAAMLHALTTFLGIPEITDQVAHIEESVAATALSMTNDGSSLVRKELLVFFSTYVKRYLTKFMICAYEEMVEEKANLEKSLAKTRGKSPFEEPSASVSRGSTFATVWKHLLILAADPHPVVARNAGIVVDTVHEALLRSPIGSVAQALMDGIVHLARAQVIQKPSPAKPVELPPQTPTTPLQQDLPRTDSYFNLMKRTASRAVSLKSLGFGSQPAQEAKSPGSPNAHLTAQQKRASGPQFPRSPADWRAPPEIVDQPAPTAAYHQAPLPSTRGYRVKDAKEPNRIPLESDFMEWSSEVFCSQFPYEEFRRLQFCSPLKDVNEDWSNIEQYFREPQMKASETEEPGSGDYNLRLWRRIRNDNIIRGHQPLKDRASSTRWDQNMCHLNNITQPKKITFAQFEDHLVVTDDHDTVK